MFNKKALLLPLLSIALYGCGGSNNDNMPVVVTPEPVPMPVSYQFKVTVTNLTYGQPFSPVGVALHSEGMFWQMGEMASVALENLAESGDNSQLLALDIVKKSQVDTGALAPGKTTEITITTDSLTDLKLSLITMMVNTNDGFSGLNAIDVSALAVDAQLDFKTRAYDAGTESNSESVGTIPGPADMGEGFNASRNDVDFVAVHPGVVGHDDGLTSSILTSAHKFDNPLLAVAITRIQ